MTKNQSQHYFAFNVQQLIFQNIQYYSALQTVKSMDLPNFSMKKKRAFYSVI